MRTSKHAYPCRLPRTACRCPAGRRGTAALVRAHATGSPPTRLSRCTRPRRRSQRAVRAGAFPSHNDARAARRMPAEPCKAASAREAPIWRTPAPSAARRTCTAQALGCALSCTCGAPTLHRICPPARTCLDVLSAPDRYTSGTRDGGELLALEPQLRRSPVLLVKHGVRRAFQNDVLARLTRARLNEVEQGHRVQPVSQVRRERLVSGRALVEREPDPPVLGDLDNLELRHLAPFVVVTRRGSPERALPAHENASHSEQPSRGSSRASRARAPRPACAGG